MQAEFGLALGFLGVVSLAASAGLALATLRLRAPSTAQRERDEIDRLASEERLAELAETIERRRKRAEASEQRRKERDAADAAAPQQELALTPDQRRNAILQRARLRGIAWCVSNAQETWATVAQSAGPFGPLLSAINSIVPFDRPGWQKFAAKAFPMLMLYRARKKGRTLHPAEVLQILNQTAIGGTSQRAIKVLRKHPELLPQEVRDMSLFSFGGATGGGSSNVVDAISAIGAQVSNIYAQKAQAKMLRQLTRLQMRAAGGGGLMNASGSGNPALGFSSGGGMFQMPSLPDIAGSVFGGIGGAAVDLAGQLLTPSAATPATTTGRARAPRIVGSINNATGKSVFYRNVGAPILFRGDLSTLKTVKKAVSKFGGLAGTRRTFRRRRR